MKKIFDRRPFSQEFRIGSYTKLYTAIPAVDSEHALQLLPRLCGYGALLHDQL